MTVAPYFGVASATQDQLIAVVTAIIGLILAYFDAKYDNTLISQPNVEEVAESQTWNSPVNCRCQIEEEAINPEYTTDDGDDGGA